MDQNIRERATPLPYPESPSVESWYATLRTEQQQKGEGAESLDCHVRARPQS